MMWSRTWQHSGELLRTDRGSRLVNAAASEWQRAFRRRVDVRDNARELPQQLADGGLVRNERLARLEAALLVADSAVSAKKLAQIARLIDAAEVRQLVELLNAAYDRERSAFRIELTAGGLVMMTRAALAPWLDRLHHRNSQAKLSQPAMETLTIVAYQQPVTRADIESIRGVQSSEMIRQLIDRGLVRVGGEDDSLGRPFLYETTREFLTLFGLRHITELPDYESLRRQSADSSKQEPDMAAESLSAEAEDVDSDSEDVRHAAGGSPEQAA
jgi:segregation and condensation protein B